MSYQVLARKYRPQSFDEVLGQEAIVTTLKNAINLSRLHQAYLFCGARGVGKTSLARIFAKSLNCEKGPTTTPCQTCNACLGITSGTFMDVLEIDGASNTGVDDVRVLREQAKYLPASGKYKVYILDEVHMLSQSAFNALLKILEEPPPHVLFLFATTEPHKIPVTILSRCQRFDCRKMTRSELVGHLQKLLAQEKIEIDTESASLIAEAAQGSVRDSLSLLDQILSFTGGKISIEKVQEVLGLSDRQSIFKMLEALLSYDPPAVLEVARELFDRGADLQIFSESLLEWLRHLLVLSVNGAKFVDLPPADLEALQQLVSKTDSSKLFLMLDLLLRGAEEMARSDYPRLRFETTLLKLTQVADILSLPQILENLGNGTQAVGSPSLRAPVGARQSPEPTRGIATPPPKAESRNDSQRAISATPNTGPFNWISFVEKVKTTKPQWGGILSEARPVSVSDQKIQLAFDQESVRDLFIDRKEQFESVLADYSGKKITLEIIQAKSQVPNFQEIHTQKETQARNDLENKVRGDPQIQEIQNILGAKIVDIKSIK